MNFSDFLEHKPLYYAQIDYERMPRVYKRIKNHFNSCKIIHLIGTNGKGTTGRFLAQALHNLGFKVGHYTSPHILNFNERIWINGSNTSDTLLEDYHQKLQSILSEEEKNSLSYFEYTTFLAMLCFEECEYIVLEAGLGGEHDATAVFKKTVTLVTPISYDHQSFLGSSIEAISSEKLNAVQNNAIIANQEHKDVFTVARKIETEKKVKITSLDSFIRAEDEKKMGVIADTMYLVQYLRENLKLSIACLNFLEVKYDTNSFENALLFGRLSKINDDIIVDVGHNPLAAQGILKALVGQKYILVYNTYEDKDYMKILDILKPIIKHVEIIKIDEKRIEKEVKLQKVLTDLKIKYISYEKIQKNQKYLVFGSFKVVEAFLKGYNE